MKPYTPAHAAKPNRIPYAFDGAASYFYDRKFGDYTAAVAELIRP